MKEKEEVKKKKTTSKKKTSDVKEKKETKKKVDKDTKEVKEKLEKVTKEVIEKKEKSSRASKKEEALLEKKSQKTLKILSNIIYIFTKICRICLMILVPFIFLAMIFIPFGMNHLEVNGNVIRFYDIKIISNDDYVAIKVGDDDYVSDEDTKELLPITDFISNNSKGDVILISEVSLGFLGAILIISIYVLMYTEKLFKNISDNEVPFTDENTNYVRRIAQVMVLSVIITEIFDIFIGIFFSQLDYNGFVTYGIVEILIVFAVYYIFQYATALQNKTKYKMYD